MSYGFPNLSSLTEPDFLRAESNAGFRAEAAEMVTLIRGPGWWPERQEHEDMIYGLFAWVDTIDWEAS